MRIQKNVHELGWNWGQQWLCLSLKKYRSKNVSNNQLFRSTLSDFLIFLMLFPNFPKFFFMFKETSLSACKASSEWSNLVPFKTLTKDGFLESCITLKSIVNSILGQLSFENKAWHQTARLYLSHFFYSKSDLLAMFINLPDFYQMHQSFLLVWVQVVQLFSLLAFLV